VKILLYSSFDIMPISDVKKACDKTLKTCLFCSYADENSVNYIAKTKAHLMKMFENVVDLTPDFDFKQKLDCIFVNGGNAFDLIYKLKKYNQFDKIKTMVENGTVYIGNSAGSTICGDDISFVNDFEPPSIEMNLKDNCQGFGFVSNPILVEASKFTFSKKWGLYINKSQWHDYLVYKIKQKNALKIGNNAVAIVNDKNIKIKKYPWKKIIEINETKN